MRIATVWHEGATRAAIDFASHYRLTPYGDVSEALRCVSGDVEALADGMSPIAIDAAEVELAVTTLSPSKIICVGLNYSDHVREMGSSQMADPTIFAKFADTLTGPFDEIEIPPITTKMDWEVELGVVIGRAAYRVAAEDAEAHIAGFVVANDVSMRDFQYRTTQFLPGKIFQGTTPVGPAMVTCDEVDFARDLELRCWVGDELVQEGRTSQMLTPVPELVAYLSSLIELRPGDLLLTGTPSGVGAGRTPPRFLEAHQTLTSEITGIGRLSNRLI